MITRITRAAMLDILHEDYLRTARAKGLPEPRVVLKHPLRNASVPIVTVVGLQLGQLIGGVVITETIFSWPGLGLYAVTPVENQDYPALMAFTLLTTVVYVVINLAVDLLYPRSTPKPGAERAFFTSGQNASRAGGTAGRPQGAWTAASRSGKGSGRGASARGRGQPDRARRWSLRATPLIFKSRYEPVAQAPRLHQGRACLASACRGPTSAAGPRTPSCTAPSRPISTPCKRTCRGA